MKQCQQHDRDDQTILIESIRFPSAGGNATHQETSGFIIKSWATAGQASGSMIYDRIESLMLQGGGLFF